MSETIVELRIFSPRWGHEDTYEIVLTSDSLEIKTPHPSAIAKCNYRERLDSEWVGTDLFSTLRNDAIYAPAVLLEMFVHAWLAWRSNELDDNGVKRELEAIADWLNVISKAKPSTDFWRGYF